MIRHIIFDFFGTLASYDARRAGQANLQTMSALAALGIELTEAEFASRFQGVFADLDADASMSLREFSMDDVATAFFDQLGQTIGEAERTRFVRAYIGDWNQSVELLPKLGAWLGHLPQSKSVLSNTHDLELVPQHLSEGDLAPHFDQVTLSVTHGKRKPHPDIYLNHLDELGVDPRETAFVGDNVQCDYLGPREHGLEAFLIAPSPVAGVAEQHRISHLFDLADRLF